MFWLICFTVVAVVIIWAYMPHRPLTIKERENLERGWYERKCKQLKHTLICKGRTEQEADAVIAQAHARRTAKAEQKREKEEWEIKKFGRPITSMTPEQKREVGRILDWEHNQRKAKAEDQRKAKAEREALLIEARKQIALEDAVRDIRAGRAV
jgi:hypothetical protein